MAAVYRCDVCGIEAKPNQQWLRISIQPFFPQRMTYPNMDECIAEPRYQEGLTAEGCSPACVVVAMAKQARLLSTSYDQLSDRLLEVKLDG